MVPGQKSKQSGSKCKGETDRLRRAWTDEIESSKWKEIGKEFTYSEMKRHRFGRAFVDRTPSPDFHCRTDASSAASAVETKYVRDIILIDHYFSRL